jgi:hypothetical protein
MYRLWNGPQDPFRMLRTEPGRQTRRCRRSSDDQACTRTRICPGGLAAYTVSRKRRQRGRRQLTAAQYSPVTHRPGSCPLRDVKVSRNDLRVSLCLHSRKRYRAGGDSLNFAARVQQPHTLHLTTVAPLPCRPVALHLVHIR